MSSIEFYRSERMARASVEPVEKFNFRLAVAEGCKRLELGFAGTLK